MSGSGNTPRIFNFDNVPSPQPLPTQTKETPAIDLTNLFSSQVNTSLPTTTGISPNVDTSENNNGITSDLPVCKIPLPPEGSAKVNDIVAKYDVSKLKPEEVGSIGSTERQGLINDLLQVTDSLSKANSPDLYALAELFLKGKEGLDFKGIREKIKKAQENPNTWTRLKGMIQGKTPAAMLKSLIDEITAELQPQGKKLGDNMRAIQAQHGEKIKEITTANDLLKKTGNAFLSRVPVFSELTHFLYGITGKAKNELNRLEEIANTTKTTNDRHAVTQYRQVVDALQSLALTLNSQYHDIEPTLNNLSLVIGGNNAAISESTNSFYTNFTSMLKNMVIFYGATTGLNALAGNMRMAEVNAQLIEQNEGLTEQSSVGAIVLAGQGRLIEAERVLAQVEAQEKLAQKILDARKTRDAQFIQAESLLRTAVAKMPTIALLGRK